MEDVAHAGRVELRCVRRRQVEQVAVAGARLDEGGVEALGHLPADLVAVAADAGADAGLHVFGSRSEFLAHCVEGGGCDVRLGAAPSCVDEARGMVVRVPEDDGVAVGVGREEGDAWAVGDEGVDAVDRLGRLVDARHLRAVHGAGDGEGVGVEVQGGCESAAGFADGVGVLRVGQAYRA